MIHTSKYYLVCIKYTAKFMHACQQITSLELRILREARGHTVLLSMPSWEGDDDVMQPTKKASQQLEEQPGWTRRTAVYSKYHIPVLRNMDCCFAYSVMQWIITADDRIAHPLISDVCAVYNSSTCMEGNTNNYLQYTKGECRRLQESSKEESLFVVVLVSRPLLKGITSRTSTKFPNVNYNQATLPLSCCFLPSHKTGTWYVLVRI